MGRRRYPRGSRGGAATRPRTVQSRSQAAPPLRPHRRPKGEPPSSERCAALERGVDAALHRVEDVETAYEHELVTVRDDLRQTLSSLLQARRRSARSRGPRGSLFSKTSASIRFVRFPAASPRLDAREGPRRRPAASP